MANTISDKYTMIKIDTEADLYDNPPNNDQNDQNDQNQQPKTPSENMSGLQIKTKKDKKRPTKDKSKPLTPREKLFRFINKYFMLLCLAVIIPVASQYPVGNNDGPLNPKITSSWIVTIVLFFFIGLGVKLEYLRQACLFWQMNVFTHFIIFIWFPCIGYSIKLFATHVVPSGVISPAMFSLLDGVVITCCLPATAASAVVFTANANGNEAAAAINCTLSNLLGIFLTPLLILIFMGSSTEIDAVDIFYKLSLRVVVPFFCAQMIRMMIGRVGRRKLKKAKGYIKKINEISLLYMVFCALSESFYVGIDADVVDIVAFLILIISLHCHAYVAIWFLSSLFRRCLSKSNKSKSMFMAFTVYDRIACIYSGASKTIALGIPLIETIYGEDPNVGMYIIPILFYHPTNLIVGSLLIEFFKKMVKKERMGLASYTMTQSATAFTDLTNQTDYGALQPYTPFSKSKKWGSAIGSDMFAPFSALPDDPESSYSSLDLDKH